MEVIHARIRISSPDRNDYFVVPVSQGPWRLLRRALKWVCFAVLLVVVIMAVPAFIDVVQRSAAVSKGLTPNPPADFSVYAPYGSIGLQAMLLWGALRGAKAVADGHVGEGLANRPIRRRGLIGLFAVLVLMWDIAAIGALVWIVQHGGQTPAMPAELANMPHAAVAGAVHIAFLGLIAPVAEELFFRGWLWTALRKSWSPALTLCCTSGLWLSLHVMDGLWRPLMLLPMGILLGLARHYGDSVRASLALHLMNNGLVVLIQLAPLVLATG